MSSKANKKPPLGKGLGALLQSSATDITSSDISDKSVLGAIAMLPISSIEANPFNPRTHFEEDALNELSKSIGEHGIIQPLTVRKLGRDKYQLISGERRFRASQLAGLTEVPAYIRVANDQTMLEMALVENIQREDLNAIEVALSYQRLLDECDLTQEQLSQKIAKSRSSITNHLRLLKLPALVQKGVRDNLISMGHARALVSAGDEGTQIDLFYAIIEEGLSVRALENLIKGEGDVEKAKPAAKVEAAPISQIQNDFRSHFGDKVAAKVEIKKTPQGSGKLVINFNSETDLNRIIEILNK
ncbi:chromosome partitioning protein, ParB family [Lishizhenia tianjinensis]|uniref:Chromosome partitioning protein, ParB family n=1 Tax=Lishizhenia tianjinensis TaxID=477690 RepID=A0A1I6YXS7_9FLAO|nr:ParB/RepB/Spo0J family partition protein [Lishizhenia tianjinensis]SFT55194.1 chromosome partitioning protein, ParB family [Lishizhenia tianjinensis]